MGEVRRKLEVIMKVTHTFAASVIFQIVCNGRCGKGRKCEWSG